MRDKHLIVFVLENFDRKMVGCLFLNLEGGIKRTRGREVLTTLWCSPELGLIGSRKRLTWASSSAPASGTKENSWLLITTSKMTLSWYFFFSTKLYYGYYYLLVHLYLSFAFHEHHCYGQLFCRLNCLWH